MSPLRGTIQSTRTLARELRCHGFCAGSTKVGEILKAKGYCLQSSRKPEEGKQHPDCIAQFEFIAGRGKSQAKKGEPGISVDTKKMEVPGKLKNPGRVLRKSKSPILVATDDFPRKELGKAIPCGAYDLQKAPTHSLQPSTDDSTPMLPLVSRR